MSARAYDEWAKNCPMARDQIVVAGTKRTRKKSSKYADDDDDAEPSTIAATINKRKTPEKSNEGGTDDEAPTKQPRTTTPTSPHPATAPVNFSPPQSYASVSPRPETGDTEDVERDEYSGDCNVTKEQLFEYGRDVAGTTEATAKEPPEKPSKVDDSRPFLGAVDKMAWHEPLRYWDSDRVHDEHGFFSPDGLVVKCLRCVGKGRTKGIITMRRNFDLRRYDSCVRSKVQYQTLLVAC